MKKVVWVIIVLTVMSQSIFAGSIPESLLGEEDAKLYIGTVEEFEDEEISSAPYVKVISATINPTEKIKGDIEIGNIITYNETHMYLKLEKGKEYLIADIDKNNVYAYEIKSKNDKEIELVESDKYDMIARLEQYINEGKYEIAEKERRGIGEKEELVDFQGEKRIDYTINDKLEGVDKEVIYIIFILVIFAVGLCVIVKKRNK